MYQEALKALERLCIIGTKNSKDYMWNTQVKITMALADKVREATNQIVLASVHAKMYNDKNEKFSFAPTGNKKRPT